MANTTMARVFKAKISKLQYLCTFYDELQGLHLKLEESKFSPKETESDAAKMYSERNLYKMISLTYFFLSGIVNILYFGKCYQFETISYQLNITTVATGCTW